MDKRLAGPAYWNTKTQVGLDHDDKALVEYYCENNQRSSRAALKQLLNDWRRGRPSDSMRKLMGAEQFQKLTATLTKKRPLDPRTGLPVGFTIGNLDRYSPTHFETAAARKGLGFAIAKFGPKFRGTRVGLWVGSHFIADDVKRDMKALLVSKNQIVTIQELGIMDLFSGDRFMTHRRPQYMDNGRRDSVKEREMRFLFASQLRNVGYSPRGTEYLAELGTAAIREPLADFFFKHSNGLITVKEPGITGKEQAIAGYFGSGGGNPRHKAPLESLHNLLQNEAGNLPAQTGHDRKPPEWLFGLEAVTGQVIRWLATLPKERAELLAAPMCEYWQLLDLLAEIDLRIAWRTDHKLEGWHRCGHTAVDFRQDPEKDEWLSLGEFLALPQSQQQLLSTAANADPRYRRPRMLAPREVSSRGFADLVRFPDHIIALMFADKSLGDDLREHGRRLNAEGKFDVSNQIADPERMLFYGKVMTPAREIRELKEREEYSIVLNPFDPRQLWVWSGRGEFLGTSPRQERISRLDKPGIEKALGEWKSEIAAKVQPLRDRHAHVGAEMKALQDHNAAVAAGEAVTVQEKKQERKQRGRVRFGRALRQANEPATLAPVATAKEEIWTDAPVSAPSAEETTTEEIW